MTRTARCSCSALRVEVSADPDAVGACHCGECQRRTGSVFGVVAFYKKEHVRAEGPSNIYRSRRGQKCDLIVMASHGRSGVSAVVLGSETVKGAHPLKDPCTRVSLRSTGFVGGNIEPAFKCATHAGRHVLARGLTMASPKTFGIIPVSCFYRSGRATGLGRAFSRF
jgi:hypothetical protein